MRGLPEFNLTAFNTATTQLKRAGYSVFNPAEVEAKMGLDPGSLSIEEAMATELPHLCRADMVVVLPGWQDSEGATIEVTVAVLLKKRVITLEEALNVPVGA